MLARSVTFMGLAISGAPWVPVHTPFCLGVWSPGAYSYSLCRNRKSVAFTALKHLYNFIIIITCNGTFSREQTHVCPPLY